ncbi:MAG TPA: LTA synthase family protein [Porticoccaceae bacterium]|nr:LTA synthase family protein [Porticoccaceae bacterium]
MTQASPNNLSITLNSATYVRVLASLISVVMICAALFLVARLTTWLSYPRPESIANNSDLWRALWTGFRFDLAIVIRANLLGLLISICCIPLPTIASHFGWLLNRYWGGLILVIAVWVSIVNFSYIGFFNRPIDSIAYNGLNYGAATIWPTVISMDPSGLRLFIGLSVTALVLWSYRKVGEIIVKWIGFVHVRRIPFFTLAIILPLMFVMLLGRGTVSTFPLSQRHLIVSSETAVNNIVPNGIVALYYGYKEFKQSKTISPALDTEGRELFKVFYGEPPLDQPLFSQFFTRTPSSIFLEKNPPNVVFNLIESMSNALLLPTFNLGTDLAGQMRQHLDEDYYFNRFLPAHDDTQKSLMSLMVNTEYSTISYSSHQHIALQTSVARVFKKAGYRTVFIYAGFEGLSNRSDYLKTQGFDEFIGAHQLRELYPAMASSVWGGEDKFVFEEAVKQLLSNNERSQPLFIVTLSVTNHPPYQLPKHHDLILSAPADSLSDRLQDLPAESLDTYRYTNDQLGRFMSAVKNSRLKSNTIVAATGDHAIRGMSYNSAERLHELSVPFYLYLPVNYRPSLQPNTNQIASHKDIMPTLYNAALSNARYPNLGRNLLAPKGNEQYHSFAYHAEYLVVDETAYSKAGQGREVTSEFMLVPNTINADKPPDRGQVYNQAIDWLTRFQLTNGPVD